jgi:pyruvate/2-oxoglutarate dehydrogenase complex dihydrolipoamide acyltransferase (E2) component
MATELRMPALSPTMEEGTLAKWLVKEGDDVKSGDILAEIETDKATMEFEAVDEGKIAKILVPEGTDGVKVGQPIALLAADGEQVSAPEATPVSDTKEQPKPASTETHRFPSRLRSKTKRRRRRTCSRRRRAIWSPM